MAISIHNTSLKTSIDLTGRQVVETVKQTRRRHGRRWQAAQFYPYNSRRQLCAAKRDAGLAIRAAFQSGALRREPCQECGARAEAHHDDYSRPLDVLWLCRAHHRKRDAVLKEARIDALKQAADSALPLAYLQRVARLQPVPFSSGQSKQKQRHSFVAKDFSVALVTQATHAVLAALSDVGISDAVLSRRLGVSRQRVNQHISGGFRTLKIIAAYADALGYDVDVVLRPKAERAS